MGGGVAVAGFGPQLPLHFQGRPEVDDGVGITLSGLLGTQTLVFQRRHQPLKKEHNCYITKAIFWTLFRNDLVVETFSVSQNS